MPVRAFQVRSCPSCGLRYPLPDTSKGGTRCPVCLAETRILFEKRLFQERVQSSSSGYDRAPLIGPATTNEGWARAVLLDNIRSAGNVGSILRSAEGFGFTHAYLCGITPTPDQESVKKTSLRAEDSVSWSYHKDAVKLARGLKKEGWIAWALEETNKSTPLEVDEFIGETVLIVGNEVTGVDPSLLELSDRIMHIPMRGEKKSFNVAVAFGIAAYALTSR